MSDKKYDTGLEITGDELICMKCDVPFALAPVHLEYLGNGFPVELPTCPSCKMVYIPEELALGKMLHVEKSLEDK